LKVGCRCDFWPSREIGEQAGGGEVGHGRLPGDNVGADGGHRAGGGDLVGHRRGVLGSTN